MDHSEDPKPHTVSEFPLATALTDDVAKLILLVEGVSAADRENWRGWSDAERSLWLAKIMAKPFGKFSVEVVPSLPDVPYFNVPDAVVEPDRIRVRADAMETPGTALIAVAEGIVLRNRFVEHTESNPNHRFGLLFSQAVLPPFTTFAGFNMHPAVRAASAGMYVIVSGGKETVPESVRYDYWNEASRKKLFDRTMKAHLERIRKTGIPPVRPAAARPALAKIGLIAAPDKPLSTKDRLYQSTLERIAVAAAADEDGHFGIGWAFLSDAEKLERVRELLGTWVRHTVFGTAKFLPDARTRNVADASYGNGELLFRDTSLQSPQTMLQALAEAWAIQHHKPALGMAGKTKNAFAQSNASIDQPIEIWAQQVYLTQAANDIAFITGHVSADTYWYAKPQSRENYTAWQVEQTKPVVYDGLHVLAGGLQGTDTATPARGWSPRVYEGGKPK